MKANLILTSVLLFLIGSLYANVSPVKKVNIEPYVENLLPLKGELPLDFSKLKSDAGIYEKIKKANASGDKSSKFYFPDLDKHLRATSNSAMVNMLVDDPPETDAMPDVYADAAATETDDTRKGRAAIDYSKVGGTHIESLSDIQNLIGSLKLPAFYIQPIGNLEAIIILNSVQLTEGGGKLGVYIGLNIPQQGIDPYGNKKSITMIFGTEDLGYSNEGGIQLGDIILLNDVAFEVGGSQKKSVVVVNRGQGSGGNLKGTYAKFGCDGIEEFGFSGKMIFSREWLLPYNEETGTVDEESNNRVTVEFEQITFTDWNDMLIEGFGITPFVLTKYQDISFKLTNANVDLSDSRNPSSLKFPEEYNWEDGIPIELWRGVYIQAVELTLPSPFKKRCDGGIGEAPSQEEEEDYELAVVDELFSDKVAIELAESNNNLWQTSLHNNRGPNVGEQIFIPESPQLVESTAPPQETCRIVIGGKDLIIDRTGLTGSLYVENQVPLSQGANVGKKWSWSLDQISVTLLQSKLVGFSVSGEIVMPITKKSTPIRYTGGLTLVDADNNGDYESDGDTKEYYFSVAVQPGDKFEFPLWNAFEVELKPNTVL